MGFDTTPSADRRIFILGTVTCLTLVAIFPMLRSYFYSVLEPLEAERVANTSLAPLETYRNEQNAALTNIGASIQQLGERGRVAAPAVAPRQGDCSTVASVGGWTLLNDESAERDARRACEAAEARRQAAALAADAGVPDGSVVVPEQTAPTPTAPAPTAPEHP